MRISETIVVQLVGERPAKLVVVDDSTGNEILLDPLEVKRFMAAAGYFARELDIDKGDLTTEYDRGVTARLG